MNTSFMRTSFNEHIKMILLHYFDAPKLFRQIIKINSCSVPVFSPAFRIHSNALVNLKRVTLRFMNNVDMIETPL